MKKILKSIIWLASMAASMASAQQSTTGALGGLPWASGFDWAYQSPAEQPAALTGAKPLVLQSTFAWNGPSGPVVGNQHAVLAYTQTLVDDRFSNTTGHPIWTHGAGVIVGEFGLGLELWFREALAGGSYGPPNAYVWTQAHSRCMKDVQGTIPDGTLCLTDTVNPGAYLTTRPQFTLQRNTLYTVRATLTPQVGGWLQLQGELWDASGALLQQGRVGFQPGQFFPSPMLPLTPSLARTTGTSSEPTVSFTFTSVPQ